MIPILSVSILTLLAIGFIWDLQIEANDNLASKNAWLKYAAKIIAELSKYKRPRNSSTGRFE